MTYSMPEVDGPPGDIDLTPQTDQTPQDLVDLSAKNVPAISAPVALDRAKRADFGWPAPTGPDTGSPGVPQIANDIQNGNETSVRQKLFADSLAEFNKNKVDAVKQANMKMWQEDPKATNEFLTGMIKAQPEWTADTVLEHKYASAYIDQVMRRGMGSEPTSAFNVGLDGHFHATLDTMNLGERVTAKNQIIKGMAEEHDARVEGMGLGSYAWNMAKSLLFGYTTWIAYTKEVGGVSGPNRLADIQRIWSLPLKDTRAAIQDRLDSMSSDPLAQQSFLHALQHYSKDDATNDVIFGAMDAATIGQAAKWGATSAWKIGVAAVRKAELAEGTKVVKSAFDQKLPLHPQEGLTVGEAQSRTTIEINGQKTTYVNGKPLYTPPEDNITTGLQPVSPTQSLNTKLRAEVQYEQDLSQRLKEHRATAKNQTSSEDVAVHRDAAGEMQDELKASKQRQKDLQEQIDAAEWPEDPLERHDHPGFVSNPVQQAVKDAVKAVAGDAAPEDVLAANGHVAESADVQAIKILQGPASASDVHAVTSQVPSLFNIDTITQRAGSFARSAAEDIAGRLREARDKFVNVVADVNSVTRAPKEAYAVGVKEAREELTRRMPDLDRLVLDVQTRDGELLPYWFNLPENSRVGVGSVSIRLGDTEKNLFADARQAANHALNVYKLDPKDPGLRIRQQGDKWYIEISKNIDETTDGFRKALITTKNQTPLGWANTLLGKFRTPEDTLSQLNRENRHTLTHGTERIKEAFQNIAEDSFKGLSKKEEGPLLRLLKANQLYEGLDGKQGQFYKSLQEFEDAYYQMHNARPSEAQARAYFGYVQLSDMDYVVRNMGWYRDKARLGIENWSFAHNVPTENGQYRLTHTLPFEGKIEKDLPWDHKSDAGIYVVADTGEGKFFRKNGIQDADKADIQEKIRNGYRVIHVYAPEKRPVGGEDAVHFVVTKDAAASQLSWKQAPYQAGGHRVYIDQFHTKQPVIKEITGPDGITRNQYSGDVAAFSHSTEAEAIEKSGAMERARTSLGKSDKELTDILIDGKLPYTATKFRSLFEDAVVDGKTVPAYFDKNHPFLPTKSGQSTADRAAFGKDPFSSRYTNFEDMHSSPFNLSTTVDKTYAGTRDAVLPKIERRGTEANPVFQLGKSPLLDPMATLNQSLGGIIRNRLMADHKTYALESWASEFGHLLKAEEAEVKANPLLFIHEPVFKESAPLDQLNAAKNALMNLKNLLGTEGDVDGLIRNTKSAVMDFIYKKTGTDGVEKVRSIGEHTPNWLLGAIKDPAAFMRSAAFHETIGLFNPVQLALQAQTMVHSIAIGGVKNGSAGMMAGTMMRFLSKNGSPEMVARMAMISENMRKFMPHMLSAEDFTESYRAFQKSGLHLVEGEVGSLDRQLSPEMFASTFGDILHKGTAFFREGERLVRYTAWNTAYKEWKIGNPGRLLDNEARGEILGRANTFGANMTRASSSTWQQGVFSVPTQFWGYPMRLAEQMLGKRLTIGEKLHAFGAYSLMYGVPSAVGLYALPAYDDMRTYALDKGYDVSNKWLQSFMTGVPSMLATMAGAPETDYASRFGVSGMSWIHDALHGNLSAMQAILGASGSILQGSIEKSSPLFKSLASTVKQDGEHPLQLSDFVEAMSSIKTLDYASKTLAAMATGIYVNKNGIDVSHVSPTEAALLGAGLTPIRVKDSNLMNQSVLEFQKAQKPFATAYEKEIRMGLDEAAQGFVENAQSRFQRASVYFTLGRFTEDVAPSMLKKAIGTGESSVDAAHNNFIKHAPSDEQDARFKAEYPGAN